MSLKPLKGQVIGEVLDGDEVSPGGIILVSVKKKKPRRVKVVAIGEPFEDKKGNPKQYHVKVGDVAFFKLASGRKLRRDRKEYLVLENDDIVAVEI